MAYTAPYIDETGMHIPTYNDILEDLCKEYRRIFGEGVYLGQDSPDYQIISAFAEKCNDCNEASLMAYNSRSPAQAVGTGLDGVVAINGIRRKVATRSVCEVTLEGDPDTVIVNGCLADKQGNIWDLPATVTIPTSGEITVTATCREAGVVYAEADSITTIMTPTLGWISVINKTEATVGSVNETDAELRARNELSVAMPTRSILDALRGALAALPDVTREVVLENDTDETDALGLPEHSICAVVEGGDEDEIANTIFWKKGPGCYTHGNVEKTVVDTNGNDNTVRFMRPEEQYIKVKVSIKRQVGYDSSCVELIKSSILDYIGSLDIGGTLYVSMLYWAAQNKVSSLQYPGFSITGIQVALDNGELASSDITLAFNQSARTTPDRIVVDPNQGV